MEAIPTASRKCQANRERISFGAGVRSIEGIPRQQEGKSPGDARKRDPVESVQPATTKHSQAAESS